jgi:predicted Fe-Mo cluster-binding NifX family protein
LEAVTDDEILRLAASVDAHSEHPVAEAIVAGAKEKGIKISQVENFESVTGKGVKGIYEGKQIGLGNNRLLEDFEANLSEKQDEEVKEWQLTGQTVMYLLIDNKVEGIVSVADTIKKTSAKAIKALQKMGVKVYMLTGDNKFTAKAVAEELNLDGFEADCLPDRQIQKGKRVTGERRNSGDGRRWHKRCSGAGTGQRGYCHGNRNRHCHAERFNHAGKRRFERHCQGKGAEPQSDAEHQTEPVFCFRLQFVGRSGCSRYFVPVFRNSAEPHDCRGCHEFQFSVGYFKCIAVKEKKLRHV